MPYSDEYTETVKGLSMQVIDPQEDAQAELAATMTPTPDSIVEDLSPMAALFYLERLAWQVLTSWTAHVSEMNGAEVELVDDIAQTLNGIATAVGVIDGVCERIGLIPQGATPPHAPHT